MVDNDPQTSLSCGVFKAAFSEQIPPGATVAAIYGGLDPTPDQVIRPTNIPNVDILPGSMAAATFNTPDPFNAPAHVQTSLRDFLSEVRGEYDIVLIDNPPTLSAATWAAMVAADYCLCPLIPEDYGTSSLSPVLAAIEFMKMSGQPIASSSGVGPHVSATSPRCSHRLRGSFARVARRPCLDRSIPRWPRMSRRASPFKGR